MLDIIVYTVGMDNKRIAQAQALIQGKWSAEVFTSEQDKAEFKAWHEMYYSKNMKRNDRLFIGIMTIGALVLVVLSYVTL